MQQQDNLNAANSLQVDITAENESERETVKRFVTGSRA
jgi:hypothetical protein